MGELQANRNYLFKFHITSFIVGLTLLLASSSGTAAFSSFSLVANTLSSLKILAITIGLLNGIGFFVVAFFSSKASKHKLFSVLSFPLAVVASVLIAYVIVVLFGAPLVNKVSETFHLACLLASSSIIPFIAGAQRDWDVWIKVIFMMKSRFNTAEGNLFICATLPVLGCLLGSAFIPLDWDRPWQAWPITCAVGCVAGFTLAHLLCMLRMTTLFSSKLQKWKFI